MINVSTILLLLAIIGIPKEDYVRFDVSNIDKETQDLLKELNGKLKKFSPGCSKENDKAWNEWFNRFVRSPSQCALNVGSAIGIGEASKNKLVGISLSLSAVFMCSADQQEAIKKHFEAKQNLTECKEASDLREKFADFCAGKDLWVYAYDKSIYCVRKDKGWVAFIIDVENMTVDVRNK